VHPNPPTALLVPLEQPASQRASQPVNKYSGTQTLTLTPR
jgi:hypothetical protein